MLITRDMLNKALEDKTPLFHNGDYIDDDVLYDLFYAPAKEQILPNGKKDKVAFISKNNRKILCSEMKKYDSKKKISDEIFCNLKCKLCGKIVSIPIGTGEIIYRTFKINYHKFGA